MQDTELLIACIGVCVADASILNDECKRVNCLP